MLQTAVSPAVGAESHDAEPLTVRAYRLMILARVLDDKLASLYRGGKIHGGVFLGRGQEALSVAIGLSLRKGDVFAPLIRDAAGRLAFCETPLDAARTYLGSPLGPMRSRDGNVHRGRPREGYIPMISHLGATISVVNGSLFAHRMKGTSGTVGVACIGDGATSTGAVHEAMNQAAVEKLPLILVVADNQYAYSTPTSRQFACESLVSRALGYGMAGHEVVGNDLDACLSTIGAAITAARGCGGPQLVIASLLRLCGHGEHDDASYVRPELKASELGEDCIAVAERQLKAAGLATNADFKTWHAAARAEVEETVAQAQRENGPDPTREDWCPLAGKHLVETFPGV